MNPKHPQSWCRIALPLPLDWVELAYRWGWDDVLLKGEDRVDQRAQNSVSHYSSQTRSTDGNSLKAPDGLAVLTAGREPDAAETKS
jgi:hypothetical protein